MPSAVDQADGHLGDVVVVEALRDPDRLLDRKHVRARLGRGELRGAPDAAADRHLDPDRAEATRGRTDDLVDLAAGSLRHGDEPPAALSPAPDRRTAGPGAQPRPAGRRPAHPLIVAPRTDTASPAARSS